MAQSLKGWRARKILPGGTIFCAKPGINFNAEIEKDKVCIPVIVHRLWLRYPYFSLAKVLMADVSSIVYRLRF
jgi:hypothetical protein